MSAKLRILLLVCAGLISGCCQTGFTETGAKLQTEDNTTLLHILRNPDATSNAVKSAIRNLGPVSEPPQFWTEIANDERYPLNRRRDAVLQLFHRHVHAGMTLAEVASVLEKPEWLSVSDIAPVELVSGLLPVRLAFGDSVFAIIPLPPKHGTKSAVYLRVSGKVEVDKFTRYLLRGGPDKIGQRKLAEIGIFDPEERTLKK